VKYNYRLGIFSQLTPQAAEVCKGCLFLGVGERGNFRCDVRIKKVGFVVAILII
jgi:hypothetical protein